MESLCTNKDYLLVMANPEPFKVRVKILSELVDVATSERFKNEEMIKDMSKHFNSFTTDKKLIDKIDGRLASLSKLLTELSTFSEDLGVKVASLASSVDKEMNEFRHKSKVIGFIIDLCNGKLPSGVETWNFIVDLVRDIGCKFFTYSVADYPNIFTDYIGDLCEADKANLLINTLVAMSNDLTNTQSLPGSVTLNDYTLDRDTFDLLSVISRSSSDPVTRKLIGLAINEYILKQSGYTSLPSPDSNAFTKIKLKSGKECAIGVMNSESEVKDYQPLLARLDTDITIYLCLNSEFKDVPDIKYYDSDPKKVALVSHVFKDPARLTNAFKWAEAN